MDGIGWGIVWNRQTVFILGTLSMLNLCCRPSVFKLLCEQLEPFFVVNNCVKISAKWVERLHCVLNYLTSEDQQCKNKRVQHQIRMLRIGSSTTLKKRDPGDQHIREYELTATPNDFNVITIANFIESGSLEIPGFQRHYVWNLGQASKLIESLILGLPVPQIFLFEQGRNKFLVIDGQQRLMSIYYFMKQRFPKQDKRAAIRGVFQSEGMIPDEVLHDDEYFTNFRLQLPENLPNHKNKFKRLNYATLGDYKTQFDLRPVRNVVIRQNNDDGDDSAIYEIFNRLNSGGVNLRPQEIRASLYHSKFYTMLGSINGIEGWRNLVGRSTPDLHMKDLEVVLRGFAMLIDGDEYAPSMVKFLNQFSRKAKTHSNEQNDYLKELFCSFLVSASKLTAGSFLMPESTRFNIALFEAVFVAACSAPFKSRSLVNGYLNPESIEELRTNAEFVQAARVATTQTSNVKKRLQLAAEIIEVCE